MDIVLHLFSSFYSFFFFNLICVLSFVNIDHNVHHFPHLCSKFSIRLIYPIEIKSHVHRNTSTLWWVQTRTLWDWLWPSCSPWQYNDRQQVLGQPTGLEGVQVCLVVHVRTTCRPCVEKYYISNLAWIEKSHLWEWNDILNDRSHHVHVFPFHDPNSLITHWVFLKILKLFATLIFQIKARHPYTNDGSDA